MKKINIIFLLSLIIGMSACMPSASDLSPIKNIKISVNYDSEDFVNTAYANKTITIVGASNGESYTAETDIDGVVSFTNVLPGVYNIAISQKLSEVDKENLIVPEVNDVVVNGTLVGIKAYENYEGSITLKAGVSSSLVISKIYYAGTKDINNKNYTYDQYIEVYNNSEDSVEMKNIYLALIETEYKPYFAEWKEEGVFAKDVFRFDDIKLAPGSSIVIAREARDHTVDAPNSVNLINADYEVKSTSSRVQNNVNIAAFNRVYQGYSAIDWLNLTTGGADPMVLFKYDGDINSFEKMQKPGATSTRLPYYMKIDNSIILDGVEILKYDESEVDLVNKRLIQKIDASYKTLTDTKTGRNGEIVERRVKEITTDGRIILMDTNNSLEDFVVTKDLTPKDYTKAELQPTE